MAFFFSLFLSLNLNCRRVLEKEHRRRRRRRELRESSKGGGENNSAEKKKTKKKKETKNIENLRNSKEITFNKGKRHQGDSQGGVARWTVQKERRRRQRCFVAYKTGLKVKAWVGIPTKPEESWLEPCGGVFVLSFFFLSGLVWYKTVKEWRNNNQPAAHSGH